MRVKGPICENGKLETQLAALAYLSDAHLLTAITEAEDEPNWEKVEMAASLIHTVHLHEPKAVRADQWMCSERESPWTGNDRGLILHRIWSNEGAMVATCLQEIRRAVLWTPRFCRVRLWLTAERFWWIGVSSTRRQRRGCGYLRCVSRGIDMAFV